MGGGEELETLAEDGREKGEQGGRWARGGEGGGEAGEEGWEEESCVGWRDELYHGESAIVITVC